MDLFGVKLVGFTPGGGRKLAATLALIAVLWLARLALRALAPRATEERRRGVFWFRQATSLLILLLAVVGLLSIWFDDPERLTTGLGLFSAGLAFALQRAVMSFAGYLVLLRGKTFRVGDRIVMGGVRGDVIELGFMQTRIMEMGQPPPVQPNADPAMWVRSRQYTGRIVTVTNDKIFDEPVYNYTREVPYVWEEMRVPVSYRSDRARVEEILLRAARRHAQHRRELGADEVAEIRRRYGVDPDPLEPAVYWRLTDNWVELTVRFLVPDHGIRLVKDAMTREILSEMAAAGIGVASTTFEVIGLPDLHVRVTP
jgi:small-conductance mechanosensitive channel